MMLALLFVLPVGVVGATSLSVLRYASTGAKDAYRLKLAKTCEVGDGLAVVNNVETRRFD
jgi:hypothetical protein